MKRIFSRLDITVRQTWILAGVIGFFWFAWSFSGFQTVYLQEIGFSASLLGLLNSISSFVTIAAVAFWGMVSDKLGSLRKVLIITLVCGCALYALTPLIPADLPFSPVLFLIFLPAGVFFRGPLGTLTDNILVRNCNELHLNFGRLRSSGSLLYAMGGFLITPLLPLVGVKNTFWLCGVLMILPVFLLFFAREPGSGPSKKEGGASGRLDVGRLFRSRTYVMFLVFTFFFYIATSCEGSFIPYLMSSVGVTSRKYGYVLAYRSLLEAPFLILMIRLRKRFSLPKLLVCSILLMSVECFGFALWADSLAAILVCCTFFGLGNGMYIGSVLSYVYELAPADLKASAQSFFAAVSSVAGILGNLAGGILFDTVGSTWFYLAVAAIFLFSALVFVLPLRKRPSPSQSTE